MVHSCKHTEAIQLPQAGPPMGRVSRTLNPAPGVESKVISPPWLWRISRLIEPRPQRELFSVGDWSRICASYSPAGSVLSAAEACEEENTL